MLLKREKPNRISSFWAETRDEKDFRYLKPSFIKVEGKKARPDVMFHHKKAVFQYQPGCPLSYDRGLFYVKQRAGVRACIRLWRLPG